MKLLRHGRRHPGSIKYRLFEILELNEKMGEQGQTLPWEGWSMGSEGLCLSAEAGGHTQHGQDTVPAHS